MTYSGCGTMIGLLFMEVATITTYNILSGTRISSHSVKQATTPTIWTHDECLRFATMESTSITISITIWEVGFTSTQPPTKVDSLPAPDGFTSGRFHVFSPTLSRLVFVFEGRVLVWDARHGKTLLDFADVTRTEQPSFSPDGRFIICKARRQEFYLWKDSPDGYIFHQRFVTGAELTTQIVSPDGESIVTFGTSVVQLWRTATDSPASPSPSEISIGSFQPTTPEDFILEFPPGEKLVAVTRRGDSTITVLDLKSGDVRVVIDAGMGVHGMRIIGSAIVAAGNGEVITWDLPSGDNALNARMNTNDSVRSNVFRYSTPFISLYISISPDLNHIATKQYSRGLYIYNMHTGGLLTIAKSSGYLPGFTPDGHVVWCAAAGGKVDRWKITGDGTPDVSKLESLSSTDDPPEGSPWRSSHGYQVTGDGWVVSSGKKRLLWLPHHWRSHDRFDQTWRGKFLALSRGQLPEAVVLELEL